jgi:large subunit ribosomal protein L4
MTKTRGLVSGTGRKPWKQKGTGRAQVGEARNPLWRKGGTVFGPQPRSYAYALPKKVERGALRAALMSRLREGAIVVIDELRVAEIKTKGAAELLGRLGAVGRTLVIDIAPDENFARSARNIPGVTVAPSGRINARDVMDARRIIATRAAVERLQEVLG